MIWLLLIPVALIAIYLWYPRRPLPEVPPWLVDPDRDRAVRLDDGGGGPDGEAA